MFGRSEAAEEGYVKLLNVRSVFVTAASVLSKRSNIPLSALSLSLSLAIQLRLLHPNSAHPVRCAVCVCVCVADRTGRTTNALLARDEVTNNTGSRGH